MENKEKDFLIYESFYQSICELINSGRVKEAGALALEILRYGSKEKRVTIFEDRILECMMLGFVPLIDKSSEKYHKAVEASERRAQMRKQRGSEGKKDADKNLNDNE